MKLTLAKKVLISFLVVVFLCIAPVIPLNVALRNDLPRIEADSTLKDDEVQAIVSKARGGKFVSLIEVLNGQVNAPFTGVDVILPENVPYSGSVEDQSDVVIGYGYCSGTIRADCNGYRVYLKREGDSWKVVQRSYYST